MSNLGKRLATAGILIPILVLFVFFMPPWTLMVPAGICLFAGSLEVMGVIGQARHWPQQIAASVVVVAFSCSAITMALHGVGDWRLWAMLIGIAAAAQLVLGLLFHRPIESASRRLAGMTLALVYPGMLLSLLVMIHNNTARGAWWAFCILTTAFFCDTGAYFAGRAFGKHPLAPTLSPKKTIEGAAGGVAGSLMATLAAHFIYLPAVSLSDAVILGLLGSAAAVLGDLVESLLKRSSGVKDAGKFFPGHGGMMDRIDGLLFTVPVFYVYLFLRSFL